LVEQAARIVSQIEDDAFQVLAPFNLDLCDRRFET
jgi:hypothetical protein